MKKYFPIATALALCLALLLCALPAGAAEAKPTLEEALSFSWGFVSVAAYEGEKQELYACSTENQNPDIVWETLSELEAKPADSDLYETVAAGKHLRMELGLSADAIAITLLSNEAGELVILKNGEKRSFTGAKDAHKYLEDLLQKGEKKLSDYLSEDTWNTLSMRIHLSENDQLMSYSLYGSSAEKTMQEILEASGAYPVTFQGGALLESREARVYMVLGGAETLRIAVRPDGTGFLQLHGWEHSISAPELFGVICDYVITFGDDYYMP